MDDLMNKLQTVLNDEESMKQIRELAGMLGAEGGGQQGAFPEPLNESAGGLPLPSAGGQSGIDPMKLMQLGQLLQNASRDDDNIRLLMALRPLLKAENQVKLERIIKLYRLMNIYPALKQSGLGGGDLLGLF